ncbi:MAG TPA: phosphatase PAP2 family protein [Vicinamibacterales bacterium]
MRTSEWLSVAFGAYIALVAARVQWGWSRRRVAWLCAAVMIAAPIAFSRLGSVAPALRDWAPLIYVLASYYAAGALFIGPSDAFEAWLLRADAWLLRGSRVDGLPSIAANIVEVLYTSTFLLIPTGFLILVVTGHESQADRYWTTVSAAEYVAFGVLPWLASRPPWVILGLEVTEATGVRRFGLMWVRRTSHCANTFPSGHTAGSLAVAMAVAPFAPVAGSCLLAVAIGIAVGCVSGRYHYAVDVVTGVVVALLVVGLVAASGM